MRDLKNPKKTKKKKPLNRKKSIITAIIVLILILGAGVFGYISISKANEYVAVANFYVRSDGTIATGERDGTEKLHQAKIYKGEYLYQLKNLRDQSEQEAMQQQGEDMSQTGMALSVDQRREFWTTVDQQLGTTGEQMVKTNALQTNWQIELFVFMANQQNKNAFRDAIETAKINVEKEYMDQNMTRDDFKKSLHDKYGISYSTYVEIKAKTSIASSFVNARMSEVTYTDEELNGFYEKNKDSIDLYEFEFALYSTTADAVTGEELTEEQLQEKKDKAEAGLEKLKKGYDFDKLIREESDNQDKLAEDGSVAKAADGTAEKEKTLELTMQQILGDPSISDLAEVIENKNTKEYRLIEVDGYGCLIMRYVSSRGFHDFAENEKEQILSSFRQEKYFEGISAIQDMKVNPIVEYKEGKIIDRIDIVHI